MTETIETLLRVVLIGVGATLMMDLWALVLRRFGVPSLDFALLFERGDGMLAMTYVAASVVLSLLAIFAGLWVVRTFA